MFSHVMLGTNDFARAAAFYDTVLAPLGLKRTEAQTDGGTDALCWLGEGAIPEFFLTHPFDRSAATSGNGTMIAFLAPSPDDVDAAYAAGLANGGTDEGAPGERPQYGVGYYGAYLRDPDGNKVHVVHRGDVSDGLDASSDRG